MDSETLGLGSTVGLGAEATPRDIEVDELGSTTGLGGTPGLGAPSEDTPKAPTFVSSNGVKKEAEDPYKDFQRVFSAFYSAEEVTNKRRLDEDENDEDEDHANDPVVNRRVS